MARNHKLFRLVAWMLALVLSASVVFAPAVASAEGCGKSAEFKLSEDGVDISAKIYFDIENMVYALMGSVGTTEGETLLDAMICLAQDCLLLNSGTILDQAYGICLPEAAEKLPQSIFAPDSGSAYALSDEDYQSVLSALSAAASAGAGDLGELVPSVPSVTFTEEEQEKLEEILTNYQELLSELLTRNMELSMAPETVQVGEQSFDTSCMTVKLGKEALCNIVGAFLDTAAKDQDLKEICGVLLEQVRAASAELDAQLGDLTSEEAVEMLWASLPDIRENALQGITEADVWLSASINTVQESNAPVRMWITVSANDETCGLRLSMGESFETSDKIELEALLEDQPVGALTLAREEDGYSITATGGSVSYVLKLQLPEDNGETWEAVATLLVKEEERIKDFYTLSILAAQAEQSITVTVFANGTTYELFGRILEDSEEKIAFMISLSQSGFAESSNVLTIQLDKQNSQYIIRNNADGEQSSVSGLIKDGGDCVIITIDEINGQPIAASITLRGEDTVTLPDSYTEILDLDEEGFGALVSILQQMLQLAG